MPMILGSTPADEYALIFASGFRPSSFARDAFIRTTAAAPSFNPDALPAVTVPSLLNAGFNAASDSVVTPCFTNSSVSNVIAGGQENMSASAHVLKGSRDGFRMGDAKLRC